MTNIVNLIGQWEKLAGGMMTVREYGVHLSLVDAARVAALADMYPRRSETQLISELLSAALDELETSMPYVQGKQVVSEDEEGNPLYEDVGPTPRFLELSRQYLYAMAKLAGSNGNPV